MSNAHAQGHQVPSGNECHRYVRISRACLTRRKMGPFLRIPNTAGMYCKYVGKVKKLHGFHCIKYVDH
jgi:hypothetical protein